MGLMYFVNNYLENVDPTHFWKLNKNTLFILRNGNYSDVKGLFQKVKHANINVVRGSSQKSHMMSPIEFRLSCYLMALCNMNYKKFCAENSFDILTKDRYLPSGK
jgi:hypothetical protein